MLQFLLHSNANQLCICICPFQRPSQLLPIPPLSVITEHRAPSFVIFNNLVKSENQILFPHQFFLSSTLAICLLQLASQMVLVLKNLPANVGDLRDTGLIPGWGRSPGEGNGFFLEKEITPVIFPGESNGQRSPVGYGP